MSALFKELNKNGIDLKALISDEELKDENGYFSASFKFGVLDSSYDIVVTTDKMSLIEIRYSCRTILSGYNTIDFRTTPASKQEFELHWNNGNDHILGSGQARIDNLRIHLEFLRIASDLVELILSDKAIISQFYQNNLAARKFYQLELDNK